MEPVIDDQQHQKDIETAIQELTEGVLDQKSSSHQSLKKPSLFEDQVQENYFH